ncbi:fasciclin domain-containing protein [Phenylobacterium aquaticum]|uniref:fasciclin domain-containing protein n=1 Tax=Phenylobacterium aquaticum TaxID=1763816 RepID=UPI0026F11550|nr:fasciclin domain-containing protein [Phenylobacterium aquaticum]
MLPTRSLIAGALMALAAGAASAQTPAAAAVPAAMPAPAAAPAPVAAPPVVAAGDVVDTLKASGQFTLFLKATDATNLTGFLKANKVETVFAPSDAAFAALPAGELARLMAPANRAELQKLLIYHMINASVPSSEFKGAQRQARTMAGLPVELDGGEMLMVNDAMIVQADIMATNGVIHVINKVLSPATAPAPTAN